MRRGYSAYMRGQGKADSSAAGARVWMHSASFTKLMECGDGLVLGIQGINEAISRDVLLGRKAEGGDWKGGMIDILPFVFTPRRVARQAMDDPEVMTDLVREARAWAEFCEEILRANRAAASPEWPAALCVVEFRIPRGFKRKFATFVREAAVYAAEECKAPEPGWLKLYLEAPPQTRSAQRIRVVFDEDWPYDRDERQLVSRAERLARRLIFSEACPFPIEKAMLTHVPSNGMASKKPHEEEILDTEVDRNKLTTSRWKAFAAALN